MSYNGVSIEDIHCLQKKLDNEVISCSNVSDVFAISEEIDDLLKADD
ncbi:hypothetical protein [Maledivibacter halophilus]|uniref:Uncharacterized protein n=1 Tax=Maledivibacter halophilus TaxID=36842 RepID=A0A1T5LSK4_9FIRM|nr:hypothetical protein [Maledivibacter halophilus]SKC78881.1 hypothetical protein SAMN02194393_03228 [Maledivibacter halophilus]